MKIGVFAPLASPTATPEYATALGLTAEDCGFHSVWAAEHVVLFDDYVSEYPYAEDGRIPANPESGFLDPFGALSYLAAITTRVRLGTGICLVPQRNPVYTAKEVANIDWLSKGRFDFGIGVGWLAEEFGATATPFDRRGARCRSYLEVMKTLWCDEVSQFEDEFYDLRPCRQYPKPTQRPHPPLHFGGESNAALRRVADIGQGWYGFNLNPADFQKRLVVLDELLAARGRSRSELEISVSPYLQGCDLDALKAYRDAGADQVIVFAFARDPDGLRATLEGLAEALVEPAREL